MAAKKKTKKKTTPSKGDPIDAAANAHDILQATLQELRDTIPDFRGGFGNEPEVQKMMEIPFFKTPIAALNRAMGGGIPGGRWTTIFGPEKVGKTSICGQTIAIDQELHPDGRWAWFDVEDTFDERYMCALGMDMSRLILVPAGQIMEDQQDALIKLVRTGFLRGFVIDSVGSYVASQEMVKKKTGALKSMKDDTMVAVPRKLSEFLRRATPQFSRHKMAQILIGHKYQGIGQFPKMEQKGGNALKHWAGMRLDIYRSRDDALKKAVVQPDGQMKECFIGFKSTIRIDKSKVSPTEGQEVEVPFIHGMGFDSVESTIRTALALGVVETRGAYYRHALFPGEKAQVHGKAATNQFIRENPSVLSAIADEILAVSDEMFGLKKVGEEVVDAGDSGVLQLPS